MKTERIRIDETRGRKDVKNILHGERVSVARGTFFTPLKSQTLRLPFSRLSLFLSLARTLPRYLCFVSARRNKLNITHILRVRFLITSCFFSPPPGRPTPRSARRLLFTDFISTFEVFYRAI